MEKTNVEIAIDQIKAWKRRGKGKMMAYPSTQDDKIGGVIVMLVGIYQAQERTNELLEELVFLMTPEERNNKKSSE